MNRRSFLRSLPLLYSASQFAGRTLAFAQSPSQQTSAADSGPTAARIPRWRGFNLQGKFSMPQEPYDGPAYQKFDFATMREWGFDFARLPLSYWAWGSRDERRPGPVATAFR